MKLGGRIEMQELLLANEPIRKTSQKPLGIKKQINTKSPGALSVWLDSAGFHLRYLRDIAGIFPLLLVPVIGDLLHSLIIHQTLQGKSLSHGKALRFAWGNALSLLTTKVSFQVVALLWGFVPIYGWIMAIRARLYWGMASNVMVFEGLSGAPGRNRCRDLIDKYSQGYSVRALWTIPSFLIVVVLLVWIVSGTIFEPIFIYGRFVAWGIVFWILVPWSGAANTFLYLQLAEHAKRQKDETNSAYQGHQQMSRFNSAFDRPVMPTVRPQRKGASNE